MESIFFFESCIDSCNEIYVKYLYISKFDLFYIMLSACLLVMYISKFIPLSGFLHRLLAINTQSYKEITTSYDEKT